MFSVNTIALEYEIFAKMWDSVSFAWRVKVNELNLYHVEKNVFDVKDGCKIFEGILRFYI